MKRVWLVVLVALLALFAACSDERACDRDNDTCRAAYRSATATCQQMFLCGAICIDATEPMPTNCDEMTDCIEANVSALCDAADCNDDFYENSAELAACLTTVHDAACDSDGPGLCEI